MKISNIVLIAMVAFCSIAFSEEANKYQIISRSGSAMMGHDVPQRATTIGVPEGLTVVGEFWAISLSEGKEHQFFRKDLISSIRIRERQTDSGESVFVLAIGFQSDEPQNTSIVSRRIYYAFPVLEEALGFARKLAGDKSVD